MKSALIFASIIAIIVGILEVSLPEDIKQRSVPILIGSFIVGLFIQRFVPTTFKSFTTPITAFVTIFVASMFMP
tara:strand:+ start:226 stop:447 length:222 start_codon:yes stop_codon:yes gene_type:complete